MSTAITPQEWYQLRVKNLKEKVSMGDVLNHLGVEMHSGERASQVSCPMTFNHSHGDKKKSARFYPETQTFKCYVCTPKAVDIIGFSICYNKSKFAEAIRWLEKEFNVEIPKAELLKDVDQVLGEMLSVEDSDSDRFEARCNYGLSVLKEQRECFTLEQVIMLYGVMDELTFDIQRTKTNQRKANVVIEKWLDKIRQIVKQNEQVVDV